MFVELHYLHYLHYFPNQKSLHLGVYQEISNPWNMYSRSLASQSRNLSMQHMTVSEQDIQLEFESKTVGWRYTV